MSPPLVIRNDAPAFIWVFAVLWFGFLAIFSCISARDGGFRQFDYTLEVGILLGFWLFGFGGLMPRLPTPRTRFTLGDRKAELVQQWLWRRTTRTLPANL